MMNNIIYMYVYVIISLSLFLREFTRVKCSENENGRRERWRVVFIFSYGMVSCRRVDRLIVNEL